MYVFHYHPESGAYTGGTPCDFCQLKPGTVLVPAWATNIPPPAWNSAVEWPYYVQQSGTWQLRVLPAPVEPAAEEGVP